MRSSQGKNPLDLEENHSIVAKQLNEVKGISRYCGLCNLPKRAYIWDSWRLENTGNGNKTGQLWALALVKNRLRGLTIVRKQINF